MKLVGLFASGQTLDSLFIGCLLAGLGLAFLLFVTTLAGRAGALRFRGISSFSRLFHRARVGQERLPALLPISAAAFLMGFGLAGELVHAGGLLRLTIATLAGLSLLGLVMAWLHRLAQSIGKPIEGEALVGATCVVTLPIPLNGVGSIAYTSQGKRHTIPARESSGLDLPKGERAIVMDIKAGVAVVESF
jgi:hypothetical protein